jgi:hypothetical protein
MLGVAAVEDRFLAPEVPRTRGLEKFSVMGAEIS